jgi:hypothetical protein
MSQEAGSGGHDPIGHVGAQTFGRPTLVRTCGALSGIQGVETKLNALFV